MNIELRRIAPTILKCILFLSTIKFLNLQSALCGVFFILILGISIVQSKWKVSIFRNCITVILFFIFFAVFYFLQHEYNYGIVRTAIFSCFMYMAGNVVLELVDFDEEQYIQMIFCIAVGMALFGILTFFSSYTGKTLSSMNVLDRYVPDFWSGLMIPPTNFNTNFLMSTALCPFIVFRLRGVKRIGGFLVVGLGLMAALGTATRTNFAILFISFGMYVGYNFLSQKQLHKPQLTKKTIIWFAVGTGILIYLCYKYFGDIMELVNKLNESMSYRIGNYVSIGEDPRWRSWWIAFIGLFDYPFGGNPTTIEAHNIILEAGVHTGIIPAVLLTLFFVNNLRYEVKIIKNKNLSQDLKFVSALTTFLTFIAMMIEPVFLGRPYIFIYMCFIFGMNECISRVA